MRLENKGEGARGKERERKICRHDGKAENWLKDHRGIDNSGNVAGTQKESIIPFTLVTNEPPELITLFEISRSTNVNYSFRCASSSQTEKSIKIDKLHRRDSLSS